MNPLLRLAYLGFGWLMVAIGAVGVVLPGLPTTPFLIVAVWCFARSSERFERYLIEHPTYGPTLRAWREKGAIPRRAKILSVAMMSVSFPIFLLTAHPSLLFAAIVAAFMLAGAAYVLSRPTAA
ncbi:YbaN family protein [Rhizobiaceae bacterium BDR2-2]|uniref:YbaN family protein n=2 Tax=Ectorhizobium quercum TaxID=2965071 RepID=A0AAE3N4L4_9HYPH|nr:YbaN family protein [Ectorhizobium quercum]MCX8999584.1 YbaN family protein [Ectorhizobium quercum]